MKNNASLTQFTHLEVSNHCGVGVQASHFLSVNSGRLNLPIASAKLTRHPREPDTPHLRQLSQVQLCECKLKFGRGATTRSI